MCQLKFIFCSELFYYKIKNSIFIRFVITEFDSIILLKFEQCAFFSTVRIHFLKSFKKVFLFFVFKVILCDSRCFYRFPVAKNRIE